MTRVKQIGKHKGTNGAAKPNGTSAVKRVPQSHSADPNNSHAFPLKSPTQPVELSEGDRAKIKGWLDRQARPFSVATSPPSRKRKRASGPGGGGSMQLQSDLFEDRLSVQYEVRPADKWESLRRYKKFTVGSESIAVGQYILVKHDELEESQMDVAAQWKAKVLEVRALDSEHVYIRVAWLNRPEDLASGRLPHHGRYELIPTNFMDIIDAMTVNGSLEVHHWNEKDDDSPVMDLDEFFWRQTYDGVTNKGFSKLRQICVDSAAQNPDELILQCSNMECRRWMHVKCIAEYAVQRAADEANPSSKKAAAKKIRARSVVIGADSQAQAKAETGGFTAEVLIKDLPQGERANPASSTEVIITNPTSEKHIEDVGCLFCGTRID